VPSPGSCQTPEGGGLSVGDRGMPWVTGRSGMQDTGGVANDAERARPIRLIWRTDDTGATWGLSGHFWATVRQGGHDEHTVWSWMVIGCETQVLAAGQTGDLAAAKLLVEEWDRWVSGLAAPAM
jgi:hypothetical protein